MPFRLESDFAEAYECVASLNAYNRRNHHKTLEAGSSWIKQTAAQLSPALQKTLDTLGDLEHFDPSLYIRMCPGGRTTEGFVHWLSHLSSGELYELAASTGESVASDLPDRRNRMAEALLMWNDEYFRKIDPAILLGLRQAAEAVNAQILELPPEEVFEAATCGMRLAAGMEPPEQVILVPQYHQRPFNLSSFYPKLVITMFPVDALAVPEGYPPPSLLRMARALDDESRLRMLRFIADHEQVTFTQIVQQIGISKSTVHYHLTLLRAAGLLTVYVGAGNKQTSYSLRNQGWPDPNQQLSAYLHPDSPTARKKDNKRKLAQPHDAPVKPT
ncbi:hypothetical protein B9G55_01855 [Saccharibacillus sp. O16]|nr:hypothetical protein B9G55_01855 [Saccharibacillus sp. O16]